MNVLFVCSQNRWRSPTAENIFSSYPSIQTRSAGISANARIKIGRLDLNWADLIFVMESKHLEYLKRKFPDLTSRKKITVLHIPDKYGYMDERLIQILESKLKQILTQS